MSSKTKVDFKLSKKGPCTVYAEDLQGAGKIIEPGIPITILNEGHQLELVATARLGLGINHAKHIPGLCYYRHLLEIKSSLQSDKIIQSSKAGLIKPEKKGQKWICDLNDAELKEIEQVDKDSIQDSNEMLLIVESYGNLPAKDILTQAIKALESNLDDFEKKIK
jgi:DNA-directed RNA polymerase subunit D